MPGNSALSLITKAVFLSMLTVDGSRKKLLSIRKTMGPIQSMTDLFKDIAATPTTDVAAEDLHEAYVQLGELWTAEGFGTASKELNKNIVMLKPCAEAKKTIGQCLAEEAEPGKRGKTAKGHKLQDNGKHAVLNADSFANGLLWSCRIVGYMAEMFDLASKGQSLKDAGMVAFSHRLAPAFKTDWGSKLTKKAVETALSFGLPSGNKEKEFITRVGGESVAKEDMGHFAAVVLPLTNCLIFEVQNVKLDDTVFPEKQLIPSDQVCPTANDVGSLLQNEIEEKDEQQSATATQEAMTTPDELDLTLADVDKEEFKSLKKSERYLKIEEIEEKLVNPYKGKIESMWGEIKAKNATLNEEEDELKELQNKLKLKRKAYYKETSAAAKETEKYRRIARKYYELRKLAHW